METMRMKSVALSGRAVKVHMIFFLTYMLLME